MEKEILLPDRKKREMVKTFKTYSKEIARALSYQSNSPRAKMLRSAAYERGGILYTGKSRSAAEARNDLETTFDPAGVMRQVFSDRVRIEVDFAAKKAGVFIDGDLKMTVEPESVEEYERLQIHVADIANYLINQ